MIPTLPTNRCVYLRLALAGLVVIGLLGGTVSKVSASDAVSAKKGHRCACGMDCGSVCCCKHKATEPPKPIAPAQKDRTETRTGPCMGSAPCGGALPPGVSVVTLVGEKADHRGSVSFLSAQASTLLVPPGSDLPRTLPGSPPDEPPESTFDA